MFYAEISIDIKLVFSYTSTRKNKPIINQKMET